MESLLFVIVLCVLLCSNFLLYKLGYIKGARRVLNEWRSVNETFGEEQSCPHGYNWNDCPDCRH